MKNIQKYIIWLVILGAVSIALPFVRDMYFAQQYGSSSIPSLDKAQWKFYILIAGIIQNIASAMWLVYLAKTHKANGVIWGAFGLTFGLFGVGLFYLVSIHENQKT